MEYGPGMARTSISNNHLFDGKIMKLRTERKKETLGLCTFLYIYKPGINNENTKH